MDLDWLLLTNLLLKQKLYVHISPTYISLNVFASSFYGFHVSILVRYRVSEYPRNRKVILRKQGKFCQTWSNYFNDHTMIKNKQNEVFC